MNEQMKKGQNRRKRIVYIILGVILLWASYTWYGQKEILETKSLELQELEAELNEVQLQNDALKYKVLRLNDPEYIANLARKNYYLSKEGEIIFEIISTPPNR